MAFSGASWRGSLFGQNGGRRGGGDLRGNWRTRWRGASKEEGGRSRDSDSDDADNIADKSDRGNRSMGMTRGAKDRQRVCRYIVRGQDCRFGKNCHYSHDVSGRVTKSEERFAETEEQQKERQDYNSWKWLIKRPPVANDTNTIETLWTGALNILNNGDREWNQRLPRDLDSDENYGREHIQTMMSMVVSHADGSCAFIALVRPFIAVITHRAMLDCLSVDTFVGGLYNFISGSNGTRAVPFFQQVCTHLMTAFFESNLIRVSTVTTLAGVTTALRELLKREQRVAFHEDLPDLVDSLEYVAEACGIKKTCANFEEFSSQGKEIRAIIARAKGLLVEAKAPDTGGISTTVVKSTFPRNISTPGGRHDNDNKDFTKIKIFPTEGEIRSDSIEFLPTTDFDQPHFLNDPVERHLDTQFRLLRHDIFGELKEALWGVIDSISNDPTLLDSPKLKVGDMRAYHYVRARISYLSFNPRHGMEASVSFRQPSALREMSTEERCRWWADSKRVEEGALLCFVALHDNKVTLLFLCVSEKVTDPRKRWNLGSDKHYSTILAKLVSHDQADLELLTNMSCQKTRGALIEFPGLIAATFMPVLENLQTMQRSHCFPFRQWILPERCVGSATVSLDIPPPLYARGVDFFFSLDSIVQKRGEQLQLRPGNSIDDVSSLDELEERTTLDRGQCHALMAALNREFAFIQGPPGTGKSYLGVQLMRVLLACKHKARLGPVIVLCYTNHALDQFLEHLINIGVEKIIRIGGQSKSQALEGKNLRVVSQDETKTRSERYLAAKAYEQLGIEGRVVGKALGSLHIIGEKPEWARFRNHLQRKYPPIASQFSRSDYEGFQLVGKDPFMAWSQGLTKDHLSEASEEVTILSERLVRKASRDVHSLSTAERYQLVETWRQEIQADQTNLLFESLKSSHKHHDELRNIHDEVDRRTLQDAEVIGVTTTGLAKRISVLRHVQSKVVICEEAGEVMEPHILSALLPDIEHFIQIGDHQQLRPQINNFGLSLENKQGIPYQLDRSQFERLSMGQPGRAPFPVAQLNVQRRMRPEISTLIRKTVYPNLTDHKDTKDLPNVIGMRSNVFWLDHQNLEELSNADRNEKSHSNNWEVDMTHALVRHIVRQGAYDSSDVAVLTPYTGQLQKLRRRMQRDFEVVLSDRDKEVLARDGFDDDVIPLEDNRAGTEAPRKALEKKKLSDCLRIATVDNFQGEESKIVIVSLVRSNETKKVGFLRTTNRINVLLSRAQHGLYLIGNADTYSNVPMWAEVLEILRSGLSIGNSFGLCCPRHRDTEISVSEPIDFEKLSPEGGCRLTCSQRLNGCGHKCLGRCHSASMHNVFECPQPCQRLHSPCNHGCQKQTCGEDCGPCMIKLDGIRLPCGHLKDGIYCYQTQALDSIRCKTSVQKRVSDCKHILEVPCHEDVDSPDFKCSTPCEANLPCGHRCSGTCGRCNHNDDGTKHQHCTKICGRRFGTCNHTCSKDCHDGTDCGPCRSRCEVQCSHSRCTLYCHEACAPCIEKCEWFCEHQGGCEMPCGAPCSRLPCDERCLKTLSCGHRCPGICGEKCADGYCHQCSEKLDARVDFLEMKSYREIDVDETPIVVLGCGHFFTAESLDGHMGMSEVYENDKHNDKFIALRNVSATMAGAIPSCPDCKCPVRQFVAQRYNRVINRAVIDEMSKRFLTNGNSELGILEQQIIRLEQYLGVTRERVLQPPGPVDTIYTPAKLPRIIRHLREGREQYRELECKIKAFRENTKDKNQPAQKLHEATAHAQKAANAVATVDNKMTNLSFKDTIPVHARGLQITMGGQMADIKAQFIILEDKFLIARAMKEAFSQTSITSHGGAPGLIATSFLQRCSTFIDECYIENLPKLAVESSILYAGVAQSLRFCHSEKSHLDKNASYVATARKLLENAQEACKQPFQNADTLCTTVEELIRAMKEPWYEEITAEEVRAIKLAMVSGSAGIATHSGHWYNCVNGHPFAIGECGMPMELARCPDCGATIGGENHQGVEGVTRAEDMEAV